jgi:hypothetical protein
VKLYYEWGTRQLNKRGEELCGDSCAVSRARDSVTLALSDGLGSGVKANILATLTTRIAIRMLENDLTVGEVVETLGRTLPVCQFRKMAYSAFAIARLSRNGRARIVEFDTPSAIVLRDRVPVPLAYDERRIGDKTIHEVLFDLQPGDWVVFVSDGVINAGIGGAYPLGWGSEHVVRYLARHARPELSAQDLAEKIATRVDELYNGVPGDDVTVVAIKARHKLVATVLTGPPLRRDSDERVTADFVRQRGRHVVCGGTTAKIVSRHIGRSLDVDLETTCDEVPPRARMETMDLVTEGILTLTETARLLNGGASPDALCFRVDGAAALVRQLTEVDHVHFLVGMTVNAAHQNPDLPRRLGIKLAVVREIAEALRARGIDVTIETV